MILQHYFRWLLIVLLPMIAGPGHASIAGGAFGFGAPGVGEPSSPFFLDIGETVKIKRNGTGSNVYWTLTGKGSTTSFWGGDDANYQLGKDKFTYRVNFNAAGELITSVQVKNGVKALTNFLEIKGTLPAGAFGGTSWGALPNQLLLSADLVDVGTSGPFALGFKTEFTGGWAANNAGLTGGSSGENLWLFGVNTGFQTLVAAISSGDMMALKKSMTVKGVVAVASVPLPAAFWLFGAGLLAMLAGRRKSATDLPAQSVPA